MTGLDLSTAQEDLAAARVAYRKALAARSVGFGDRSVTRHDIAALAAEVERLEQKVRRLSGARTAVGRVTSRV